jgi:hypothetical protein
VGFVRKELCFLKVQNPPNGYAIKTDIPSIGKRKRASIAGSLETGRKYHIQTRLLLKSDVLLASIALAKPSRKIIQQLLEQAV